MTSWPLVAFHTSTTSLLLEPPSNAVGSSDHHNPRERLAWYTVSRPECIRPSMVILGWQPSMKGTLLCRVTLIVISAQGSVTLKPLSVLEYEGPSRSSCPMCL